MNKNKMSMYDANYRDNIIFNEKFNSRKYVGGIRHFTNVSLDTIITLIERGFANPSDKQNEAPSILEFCEFVKNHNPNNWYFHGYAVSPNRYDCRVSVEGIGSVHPLTSDDLVDFISLCKYADTLIDKKNNPVYCWYT